MRIQAAMGPALLLLAVMLLPLPTHAQNARCDYLKERSAYSQSAFVPDVTAVDVSYCELNAIDYGNFYGLRNVITANLSHNNINIIVSSIFTDAPGIVELDLSYNRMEYMPQFGYKNLFVNITKFLLQHNFIDGLCHLNTFSAMGKLELLDLGYNKIAYIKPKIFEPLVSLKELHLEHNVVSYISSKMFGIRSLKKVFLNDNMIQYVAADAFLGSSLDTLWLQGNRLSYLPENFLLALNNGGARILLFPLSNNPWQCRCLLELLKDAKTVGVKEYASFYYHGTLPSCVMESLKQCKRPSSDQESMTVGLIEQSLPRTKSCFY